MNDDLRHDELIGLAFAICDGTATDDQIATVENMIAADPAARLLYLQCMELHFEMDYRAMDSEGADSEPPLVTPSLSPSPSPLASPFVGGLAFSYMVASVVLCMMLLGAWAYKTVRVDQSHSIGQDKPIGGYDRERPEYVLVGQITGMEKCRWENENDGTMLGAAVYRGRKYAISSGLMEITYKTGARVVLEGPCEYTADSPASGYLRVGKLVARVEKRGEWRGESGEGLTASGAHEKLLATSHWPLATNPQPPAPSPRLPLFTITTPSAVVTDLGTEFGVEVDASGNTNSRVFQGSVKFETIGSSANSVILNKHEAAAAQIGPKGIALSRTAEAIEFVRHISMPKTEHAGSMPIKDSADFAWKYEMDADPTTQDLDGNSVGDWREYWGNTATAFDGVMRMGPNGDDKYPAYFSAENGSDIWANISDATGFTFEIRLKSAGNQKWHGYTGAMYIRLSDENIAENMSDLVITNEATLYDHENKFVIDGNANNDGYHVFRVAQQPNSGQYYIWRDNKLIYKRNGLLEKTGALRIGRAFFGYLSTAAGPSEVDYVRLTAGAFAPVPSPANQNPK